MNEADIQASYTWCEALAQRAARHFYPAFRILPAPQRRAMCALYAFMRVTDDLADEPGDMKDKRIALFAWRRELEDCFSGMCTHALHPALLDTVARFSIPQQYLEDVLDGVEMDLAPVRYDSFAQLYDYCYHVASAVGLACIHIWGFSHADAKKPAEAAGIALQLTNILRDLGEDRAAGRVYLPTEDLDRFDCAVVDLGRVELPAYRQLMAFEVERARGYYAAAEALGPYLPRTGRSVFNLVLSTYRGILNEIERRGYDVMSSPIRLGRWTKFRLALKTLPARWGLTS
jgi:15-cis-phytoene synthase